LTTPITSTTVLPARRHETRFHTSDGLTLVGEVAWPLSHPPMATALFLHPLPTAGGFMDSHVIRKASWRLPALADIAVFRFNFRGVTSPRGTSEGQFGEGIQEKHDLEAALAESERLGLPAPWLIGWSFGTEVILKHARALVDRIAGVILLSPPLHRTSAEEVAAWSDAPVPVVALIPEFDDFLPPKDATAGFAPAPKIELVMADGAKHLWVGETQTRFVLNAITKRLNPDAAPLPEAWSV
jgi:alpha/beta superfamily hydrolase